MYGKLKTAGYQRNQITEDEDLSARSLTLLIFATGWAVCGRPQPGHESVMPVLWFSLLSV